MNSVPLLDVAPLTTDRIKPFDNERPYIATGGLDDDGNLSPEMVTYENRPSRADLVICPGDVCMARMQGTRKVFHFKAMHLDLILSTGFAIFRPMTDLLDSRYIFHYLRTSNFQNEKDALCSGATQKAITNEKIATLRIPLLPLPDQRRIANILDLAEALRAKRRATLDQLDELTQSIFVNMFGDPVNNSSDSEIISLEDACSEIYRYPTFYGFEYVEKGVPVVRIGNIRCDGSLDSNKSNYVFIDSNLNKKFPRTILELNDIVMAVRGDGSTAKRIGMVNSLNIVGANISPNLIRIKANRDVVNPIYLFYFLTSAYGQLSLQQSITRTAKKTITAENIKKVSMLCPSIENQNKFAEIVRQVEEIKRSQQQSLLEINSLFDSLTHEAFTGKLSMHQFFERKIEKGVKI